MRYTSLAIICLITLFGITCSKSDKTAKEKVTEKKEISSVVKEHSEDKPDIAKKDAEKASEQKDALKGSQKDKQSQEKAEGKKPSEITVVNSAICRSVKNHEPKRAGKSFRKNVEELNCFSHIKGAEKPMEIVHKWYFGKKLVFSIPLKIKTKNWRTRSCKKIHPSQTGKWKVEIVNKETGDILKTENFEIR